MSGYGTVEGRVRRTSGEPLAKAQIRLGLIQGRSPVTYATDTGADGGFSIPDVEPGQYRLTVARNGFVNASSDPLWFDSATVLTIAKGATVGNLDLRMAPQCAISGRMTDQDGEAVADVPVTLLHPIPIESGASKWQRVGSNLSSTNDLGEFRIAGLRPGKYVIEANGAPHLGMIERSAPVGHPERLGHPATIRARAI
ncbi:MAG TPA: carboxypeptidase-like regulatory domain-containing protein [Bryobacteraceae bacterium]|nr:carboxypeptidase-like regulatory domain-containing protein [Bryobacteraceae bacterium]